MRVDNFPAFGFGLNWQFYRTAATDCTLEAILRDLQAVLEICERHELLRATYYLSDGSNPDFFEKLGPDDIVSFLRSKIKSGEISGEIARIGGVGQVYSEAGEKIDQPDLVTIDSIRLFEQNLTLRTSVNCWTPLAMDSDFGFHWQPELAENNKWRLETCLREIKNALAGQVEPAEDELDTDQPVWQKGFQLFWNPAVLRREYESSRPQQDFDLDRYLLKNS